MNVMAGYIQTPRMMKIVTPLGEDTLSRRVRPHRALRCVGGIDTVIRHYDLGQMIGILSLSYAGRLFESSFLRIRDKQTFVAQGLAALGDMPDAHYDPGVGAWIFDWDGYSRKFVAGYIAGAPKGDISALDWWVRNGYNGIYNPDLTSDLWHSSLHWAKHNAGWSDDLEPAVTERTRNLLRAAASERRSDEHMAIVDDVRDHGDTDVDMFIKTKTHIDFYDDLADPLLLFTCMRGKFVLMEAVNRNIRDVDVMAALNRIPAAWYAGEGYKYTDHNYRDLVGQVRIEELADAYAWRN